MLRKLALSGRVTATVVGVIVVFVAVCGWLTVGYRNHAYEAKRTALKHLADAAAGMVDHYVALEQKGVLTADDARKEALEALRPMRYNGGDYFWINDVQHKMVMHPTNAAMEGKVLSDYKDPDGRKIFVEFVDVATKSGGGVVEYQWPKPGSTESVPKFAYVKHVPRWGWVIGTGVYVDDVKREVMARVWILLLVTLLATAAAGVAVVMLIRSSVKPVQRAVEAISKGATEVTAASHQVAAASQSLSQGATTQAASLEETSASMEEMASMTRQNAESAHHAAELMAAAEGQIRDANRSLEQLIAAMNGIQESSGQVAKIIKTIDEIAFQTNILALNAAVEAARAGEAGMGFAVVAGEVRNLAQRAAQAAKDTSALIEQAGERAKDGHVRVDDVAKATAAITRSALEVKGLIDGISVASRQQAQGIDQVTQAVSQMEQLTQNTAAVAEESAAASEELAAQAEATRDVAGQLGRVVGTSIDVATDAATPAPPKATKIVPIKAAARTKSGPSATKVEHTIPLEDTGTFGRF